MTTSSREKRIFAERVQLLFKQWPTLWGGNLVAQTLCTYVLWGNHAHSILILWCLSNYALFGLRLLMRFRLKKEADISHEMLKYWAHDYVYTGLMSGVIWGLGAWFFFDTSQPQQLLFLFVVMLGVTMGALPALSSYRSAYTAFSISLTALMASKLWFIHFIYSNELAALSLLFLGVCLFYSRNFEKTVITSIALGLRNQELLAEVTQARDKAEQANKDKSHFLASVSHDLRQPLSAMGLFMAALDSHLKTVKTRALFKNITAAREALESMFDALLDVSRLESGVLEPTLAHACLQPMLDDLYAVFSAGIARKNLSFMKAKTDAVVYTDTVLLCNILRNLLDNAIKYTDEGGIRLDVNSTESSVNISIIDTGKGILKSQHALIFKEYCQLDNPERDRSKGLGLGLSVVKHTAELLNYPLQLESKQGKGSRFTLTLPLGDPKKVGMAVKMHAMHDLTGVHVLVVDDNAMVRAATLSYLEQLGCVVSVAATVPQALNAVRRIPRPVDALLCDYRLQNELTGIDVIATLRKALDAELPALLVTGDTEKTQINALKQQGYYVLNKPVQPVHLHQAIARLLYP